LQEQAAGAGEDDEVVVGGAEAGAGAAVRLHDQERRGPPGGRIPMEEVRTEGRQEQPLPQVYPYAMSMYIFPFLSRVPGCLI
jgi:hypothetical protein